MVTRKMAVILTVVVFFAYSASSEISAVAYSKEDALHEDNISKPRIFIENTGSEPISNFYYLYYFTTEHGNEPVLEDYYTPNESVSLVRLGRNKYAVRYDCPGITLYPGDTLSGPDGNIVGIHYPDWEPIDKRNDASCNFSYEFQPNDNIAIFISENHPPREPDRREPPEHEKGHSKASVNIEIRVGK